MKKGLLLGNYTDYQWHDLAKCDDTIIRFLSDIAIIEATEQYNDFTVQDFGQYDVLLIHSIRFDFSEDMIRALMLYVVRGGAMVVFHASALTLYTTEFAQMVGAAFKMHPPYRKMQYIPEGETHVITKGIQAFELEDEPFQYHFDDVTHIKIFLHYMYNGLLQPAGWCHEYGRGRIVYLQPGHQRGTFENGEFQKIIRNSVLWSMGEI